MLSQATLHSTYPSLNIQVGSLPSKRREDVVDAVKIGLETLRAGDVKVRRFLIVRKGEVYILVQEYHGIGMQEFDELYDSLLEARVRYILILTNLVTCLIPILDLTLTPISRYWLFIQ